MPSNRLAALMLIALALAPAAFAQAPRPPAAAPAQAPTARATIDAERVAKTLLPGVVTIIADNGASVQLGSGFFVRPGVLATNLHVVRYMTRGGVLLTTIPPPKEPKWWVVEVLAVDEKADLALLSVPGAARDGMRVLPLAARDARVRVGQKVFALGSPKGLSGTISEGIVSAGLRTDSQSSYLQISAPISHGSSGGPVVDAFGDVIGVTVATEEDGQNLNFAVPVAKLAALLGTLDRPRRERAETMGALEHAWRATPSVQRQLGADSYGSPFADDPGGGVSRSGAVVSAPDGRLDFKHTAE